MELGHDSVAAVIYDSMIEKCAKAFHNQQQEEEGDDCEVGFSSEAEKGDDDGDDGDGNRDDGR